jgi:hypothetical protein
MGRVLHTGQKKIVKNADLKFFKDLYKGQSAADIASRVIARHRPTTEPLVAVTDTKHPHSGGKPSLI